MFQGLARHVCLVTPSQFCRCHACPRWWDARSSAAHVMALHPLQGRPPSAGSPLSHRTLVPSVAGAPAAQDGRQPQRPGIGLHAADAAAAGGPAAAGETHKVTEEGSILCPRELTCACMFGWACKGLPRLSGLGRGSPSGPPSAWSMALSLSAKPDEKVRRAALQTGNLPYQQQQHLAPRMHCFMVFWNEVLPHLQCHVLLGHLQNSHQHLLPSMACMISFQSDPTSSCCRACTQHLLPCLAGTLLLWFDPSALCTCHCLIPVSCAAGPEPAAAAACAPPAGPAAAGGPRAAPAAASPAGAAAAWRGVALNAEPHAGRKDANEPAAGGLTLDPAALGET